MIFCMLEDELSDPQRLKSIEDYNKNFRWFMDNFEKIKDQNRGKFVAVYDGRVVASDREPDALTKQMETVGISNPNSVFRRYIPEKDDLLVV
jgi:hypothetical protein